MKETIQLKRTKLLIETDELILGLNFNDICYIEQESDCQLIGTIDNRLIKLHTDPAKICSIVRGHGFISLTNKLFVNPNFICEYNINQHYVKLQNGVKVECHIPIEALHHLIQKQ